MPDDALPRLTLAQLDTLRAVVLTRSVTEAARLLGVSQPAVSKLIRQVERSLGLPLLAKDGHRVLPTADAEKLGPEVEKLFGALDAIQRVASTLRGEAGTVCVAGLPTQAIRCLVPAAHRLRQQYPHIKIELLVLTNQPVIDSVLSGRADFGMIHSITPVPDLKIEDLSSQRVVCIAPLGHRFESLSLIRVQELCSETFISYGQDSAIGRRLKAAFQREGLSVPVQIAVGASNALVEAVRIGAGVGLIEEGALSQRDREHLVVRLFEPMLSMQTRIVSMPGRAFTKEASLLLEQVRFIDADISG